MTCMHQPELTDDQISDLLDGRATADLQFHLDTCPYCRNRFEQARRLEQGVFRSLHRLTCPPADTLRDYAFDLLNANAQQALAAHLQTCPRCRDELRQLNDFLSEDVVIEIAPRKPVRTSHHPLPNIWHPQPIQGMPVFAMRGRDSSEPMMLETNGITVFLEVQSDDDSLWLAGRVLATDTGQWDGALVEVWQNNMLQAAASVKDGSFRCRLHSREPIDIKISPRSGVSILIEQLSFADEPPE